MSKPYVVMLSEGERAALRQQLAPGNRSIPDRETLEREVAAWQADRNTAGGAARTRPRSRSASSIGV